MSIMTCLLITAVAPWSEPPPIDTCTLLVDPLLIAQAEEVWKYIARGDNTLWPGWNAASTPILFYLPGVQDLLINHPDPPDGFVNYEGPVRFAGATMHLRNGKTHFDADGQNTSTDINGVRTLVVADTLSNRRQNMGGLLFDPRSPQEKIETIELSSLRADPYDQMGMIAHEAFHVYQDLFSEGKHADESTVAMYPTLSVDNNVGFALEAQWLTEALRASSPQEVRSAALNWLAVRSHRRELIPPEASAYEDGNEFAEGLAKSMEYRLYVALEGKTPSPRMYYAQGFTDYDDLGPQRDGLLRQMSQMMRGEINVNNDPYGTAPIRMRLYYSGMAIAALLDRLTPGHEGDWKHRIFEPGTTLTSIAREVLAADEMDLRRRYDELTTTEKHAALVETKTKLRTDGEAHIDDMVDAIEQGEGTLLVIDYSALPDVEPRLGFTPFGVQRVDEHRAIYHMVPISGRLRPTTVFRQTTPSPALHDREKRQIRFRLREAITREFMPSEAGSSPVDIEKLDLPGVSLELGRVTWRLQNGRLEIALVE